MYQKYTGIILKRHPLGEADELLTIYTREAGKLRFKTKATRKIKSRLAGHLQTLNEVEFEAAGRGKLPVVIAVRIKKLNSYLREDLRRFALAQVASETLYRLTPDEEQNEEAYLALASFLGELGNSDQGKQLLRSFQLRLLTSFGYKFPLDNCVSCQRAVEGGSADVGFSSFQGGLVCDNCRKEERINVRISGESLEQLRRLASGKELPILNRDAESMLDGFLQYVLERDIKSNELLGSVH